MCEIDFQCCLFAVRTIISVGGFVVISRLELMSHISINLPTSFTCSKSRSDMLWLLTDYSQELQLFSYVIIYIYMYCALNRKTWGIFISWWRNGFVNRRADNQSFPLIIQDWSLYSSHLPETEMIVSLPLMPSPFVCWSLFSSSPSPPPTLLFSFLTSPLPPLTCDFSAARSLSPPAGVWLQKSGGCWGSSQSCKRGSPPGWPRHSVVQVRKPATSPTEQWWER